MKDKGDPVGGRIFFVRDGTDMEDYIDYLNEAEYCVSSDLKTPIKFLRPKSIRCFVTRYAPLLSSSKICGLSCICE